jgi:hypothetical protein
MKCSHILHCDFVSFAHQKLKKNIIQNVCNKRGMVLITAAVVSIDLHIHHATIALSVSGASEMPHLPENMVKSEAGQLWGVSVLGQFALHSLAATL